ncbi:MAG: hypothetical protein AB8F74_19210 [Saprospiraceae bacterium]
MKFSVLQLSLAILLALLNPLFAQESTTYSLEIHSIISEYGNTLGPVVDHSVKAQWPDWEKVTSGEGDYHIKVDFIKGLEAKQYHREKVNRRQYIYDVKYSTPGYAAVVKNKNGMTILQKSYGDEIAFSPFGADDNYASPDTLADSWKLHRETFYEIEEAKYNNVDALLADLSEIMESGEFPIIESIESALTEVTEPVPSKPKAEEEKEEVVLAFAEKETNVKNDNNTSTENTPVISPEKIEQKTELPETPNDDSEIEEAPTFVAPSLESPETYTKPEEVKETIKEEITKEQKEAKIDPDTGRVAGETPPAPEPQRRKTETPEISNDDSESDNAPTFTDTSVESPETYTNPEEVKKTIKEETVAEQKEAKIDPTTGRVAGETPPIPEPQQRKTEAPSTIVKEEKQAETDEDREARLARIQAEWDQMEKEEEEQNKKPRVRYFRLGLRTLVPNLAGGHGEIVLPILDNRISLVGDFSQFNFGKLIDPFLTGESSVDNIDVVYRYYSVGANYYFRKKYARGWYLGGSYLKGLVKTDVQENGENSVGGQVDLDAGALRFGVTTGRKTFFFGFEIGAAVPLGKVEGVFYTRTDGEFEGEVINERIPVLPILNITLGVAL